MFAAQYYTKTLSAMADWRETSENTVVRLFRQQLKKGHAIFISP